MRSPLVLPGIVLLMAVAAPAAEVVEKAYPGDRTGKLIRTPLLRAGVIAEIGGRIVEFGPGETEANYLRTAPWNFKFGRDDKWEGANYGGMMDVPTDGWPGPFWGEVYDLTALETEEGVGLRAVAEAEGMRIEREMLVPAGESRLLVRIRQTNIGETPKAMMIRFHTEFRIGGTAGEEDWILWREKGRLKKRQYIPGSESPRFYFDHPEENWMAMIDAAREEAVIHRFLEPDGPYRVFFWSGHPEVAPGVRENPGGTGFFNNERYGPRTKVAPGESIEAVESLWIVRGLSRVDFCVDAGAGALLLDRERYGRDDTVGAAAVFGGPAAGSGLTAKVTVATGEGKTVAEAEAPIPAFEAGASSRAQVPVPVKSLPDGTYTVTALFSRGGESLGEARRTFDVVYALVEESREAIRALGKRLEKLRAAWDEDDRADVIRLRLLTYRLERLKAGMAAGDYEAVLEESEAVEQAFRTAEARRAQEKAPSENVRLNVDALLKRYRGS